VTKPEEVQIFLWAWMHLQEEMIEEAWELDIDRLI
jgi:hypothetical protein